MINVTFRLSNYKVGLLPVNLNVSGFSHSTYRERIWLISDCKWVAESHKMVEVPLSVVPKTLDCLQFQALFNVTLGGKESILFVKDYFSCR